MKSKADQKKIVRGYEKFDGFLDLLSRYITN